MKKYLLLTAIILNSLNVKADYDENKYYITANLGSASLHKIGEHKIDKNKPPTLLGLTLGYQFENNMRLEADYTFLKSNFSKSEKITQRTSFKSSLDSTINAFMLNGYINFISNNNFKFFAGLGTGVAANRVKSSILTTRVETHQNVTPNSTHIFNYNRTQINTSNRIKTNFSYAVYLGASMSFNDNFSGEVKYSWKNYGKQSAQNIGGKKEFKGHHLNFGIKVNI